MDLSRLYQKIDLSNLIFINFFAWSSLFFHLKIEYLIKSINYLIIR
jgi:hypothetical protein